MVPRTNNLVYNIHCDKITVYQVIYFYYRDKIEYEEINSRLKL